MESLGQKLREAREGRNVSVEQVARDTHISKQHLEALEEENFAVIPGETYVVGFLRNYAEYLSLDGDEVVSLYRNIQIQEQPLPMAELLETGRPRLPPRLILILAVAVAVLGGVYGIYRLVSSQAAAAAAAGAAEGAPVSRPAAAAAETGEYLFQEEAVTRWFAQEETIRVPLDGQEHRLRVAGVDGRLTLRIPGGTLELAIGQDRMIDLNGDGRNDLRVLLNDLDVTQTARRANIGLYKITRGFTDAATPATPVAAPATPAAATSAPAASPPPAGAAPAAEEPPEGAGAPPAVPPGTPLQTAGAPSPFRVTITFRGYCLLRYLVDKNIREERFFHKGESFSLDVRNELTLWLSNAGAVRMMVGGREVEVGRAGAVATRQIRWNQEAGTGRYLLQVLVTE